MLPMAADLAQVQAPAQPLPNRGDQVILLLL
jgi:hypothetical protein